MNGADSFHNFLFQLRSEDKAATQRLMNVCSPIILRIARPRLHQAGLSRLLDPEDIAQEVFGRFFRRVVGKREMASWEELTQLLITIAINVIRDEQRRADRLRRGSGEPVKELRHPEAISSSDHERSYDMEIEEELKEIQKLMSGEEWNLVWARILGTPWSRMAKDFGQSPNALRMRFMRLLARVKSESNSGKSQTPRDQE